MNELFSDSDKKEIDNLINEEKAINLQPEGQDKRRAENILKQKIKVQKIEAMIGPNELSDILGDIEKCADLNTDSEEAIKLFQNKANNKEPFNLHEWYRVSKIYNLYLPALDENESGEDIQESSIKNIVIAAVCLMSIVALNLCRIYAVSDEYITMYMSAVNSIAMFVVVISTTLKSYFTLHKRIINSHRVKHRKKEIDSKIRLIMVINAIVFFIVFVVYIVKLSSNLWNDVISIVALLVSLCDDSISSILTILFAQKYKIPKLMLGVEENDKTSYG